MLGTVSGTSDLVSLWALFQSTGEVFSAEWVNTSSSPVGRMYSHSLGLCWQATYSSASGYGTWVQSTTGPLGESCTSVSNATWYTKASSLTGGGNYSSAGSISSGYMGVRYMVHESANNVVFGGELDGRTLSIALSKGKPEQGEIYIVSTSNLEETLVATTETSVQTQLYSSSAVDTGSVGGLTGSSAQTLQTQLGSFATLWSNSETVTLAESNGLVSQRCPSAPSDQVDSVRAFIVIDPQEKAFASQQPSAIQRFNTSSDLQLLMVRRISVFNIDSAELCAIQVTTLNQGEYTAYIAPTFYGTLVAFIICIALYAVVAISPLRRDARIHGGKEASTSAASLDSAGLAGQKPSSELDKAPPRVKPGKHTKSASDKPVSANHASKELQVVSSSDKAPRRLPCLKVDAMFDKEPERTVSRLDHVQDSHIEPVDDGLARGLLTIAIVGLLLLVVLLWTILVSTNHRDAVDDLMVQLANATDTVLQSSLNDAKKMVKQATNTWQFTGAPVTDLSNLNVWATVLFEDFQSSGCLGALRFATTSGLEQSYNSSYSNGSFAGIRILSREFYGGSSDVCLKEYLTGNYCWANCLTLCN